MTAPRTFRLPTSVPEAARMLLAAQVDATEALARARSEFAWRLSGALPDPARWFTRSYGDLVRDIAAVQLSSARWLLDL
jgi:hypothetical protein